MKGHKIAAIVLPVLLAMLLTGCSERHRAGQVPSVSAQQSPAETTRVTSAPEETQEENDGTVILFGEKTAFEGIEVETDGNGELVVTQEDGAIWYRITDARFPSYKKFKRFAVKSAGQSMLNQISGCFREREDGLYFVLGADDREIAGSKTYYFNDYDAKGGAKVTVSVEYSADCRKKIGLYRSHTDFVRHDKVWKLDCLTLFTDES